MLLNCITCSGRKDRKTLFSKKFFFSIVRLTKTHTDAKGCLENFLVKQRKHLIYLMGGATNSFRLLRTKWIFLIVLHVIPDFFFSFFLFLCSLQQPLVSREPLRLMSAMTNTMNDRVIHGGESLRPTFFSCSRFLELYF